MYSLGEGRTIVSTVDFFTPVVDDPFTFGAIAAANAVSDIYAMGGRPLFALNIVAFPIDDLDKAILVEILRGGRAKAEEAGVAIIGGHSIDDKEPKYGLAVTGTVAPESIYRKSGGRSGDRIVLTKAIGTGIISTAIKRGSVPGESQQAAVASMLRLNDRALALARNWDVGALTDVTGYGLLGHLAEMAKLSGRAAVVESSAVPFLPGAPELAESGCVPGGTRRNLRYLEGKTNWRRATSEARRLLLCDAQTSGGLLVAVAPADAAGLVSALVDEGHAAADIGELVDGAAGTLEVR